MKRRVRLVGAVVIALAAVAASPVSSPAQVSASVSPLPLARHLGVTPRQPAISNSAHPAAYRPQQPQPPLDYFGGPVLHTNQTYLIFWDPDNQLSASYKALTERFLADVAHDSGKTTNVFSVLNQYYDTAGPITYQSTYAGAADDADPYPSGCPTDAGYTSCFSDQQLQAEIDSFVNAHGIDHPANRMFMVLTAKGAESCIAPFFCSGLSYCGYHSVVHGSTGDIIYSDLPYAAITGCDAAGRHPNGNDADPLLNIMSHEMGETIDDPYAVDATVYGPPLGWLDPYTGNESADQCALNFGPTKYNGTGDYNQVINGHEYLLQSEWSNALASSDGLGCVLNGADHKPSATFSALIVGASVTTHVTSTSDPDHGDAVDPRTYLWDFGDGTTYKGPTQVHHYARTGTYTITLQYADSAGAAATTTKTLHVVNLTPAPQHAFTAKVTATLDYQILGQGTATGIGNVFLVGPPTSYSGPYPASFTATTVGGGFSSTTNANQKIYMDYVLTMTDTENPPAGLSYTVSGNWQVTGGVGQYYGATGGGAISGHCSAASPSNLNLTCQLTYSGTIGQS